MPEQCLFFAHSDHPFLYPLSISDRENFIIKGSVFNCCRGSILAYHKHEELRNTKKPLSQESIYHIIEDKTARAVAPFKLQQSVISQFFKPDQSRDEIEEIITKALEMYFRR